MLESNGGADLLGLQQIAEQMPGGFFVYRADETEEMLYVNDVLLDLSLIHI